MTSILGSLKSRINTAQRQETQQRRARQKRRPKKISGRARNFWPRIGKNPE